MPRISRNTIQLEQQAAASILLYDKNELTTFNDIYIGTIENNDVEISGNFHQFLKFVQLAVKEGIILDDNSNSDKLKDFIRLQGENIPDSDLATKFLLWFNEVSKMDIPLNLAHDIIDHYLWNDYLEKINKIDKSDMPFNKKLSARPKDLNVETNSSSLLSLGEIDLSTDTVNNKKFTTGLEFLDESIPLAGTNLMVIAARPGVGKTLFMLQQAVENARGGKVVGVDKEELRPKKTLFISLEMSQKAIHDRVFGYLNQEDLKQLNSKEYAKKVDEIQHSDNFKNVMDNLKVLATDSSNGPTLLADIERAIDDYGIECVFVDYLQLLKFPGTDEWGSIRQATNLMKNLAFSKNVLIVTGSQVSRQSTERGLTLADLFGGSSIEADSDVIVGMEALHERRINTPNTVNIKILKNREGDVGDNTVMIDYSDGNISKADEF